MKAKDLIKYLEREDPDTEVYILDPDDWENVHYDIDLYYRNEVHGFKHSDYPSMIFREPEDAAEAIKDDLDSDPDIGRTAEDFTWEKVIVLEMAK